MKRFALWGALAVFAITGCAQVDAGIDRAEQVKQDANNTEAKAWQAWACNLSLGGVRRELDATLRQAVLEYCLQDVAPDE